ncbi:hypothetical protein QZH47_20870 [Pseudomonas corrugata]
MSFNELEGFRRGGASVHRSRGRSWQGRLSGSVDGSIFSVESGEKEVLTAAANAVKSPPANERSKAQVVEVVEVLKNKTLKTSKIIA